MGEMADLALEQMWDEYFDDDEVDISYHPIKIPLDPGIKCPKCGKGRTVIRINKTTHTKFCGCSRFPSCKLSSPLKGKYL